MAKGNFCGDFYSILFKRKKMCHQKCNSKAKKMHHVSEIFIASLHEETGGTRASGEP